MQPPRHIIETLSQRLAEMLKDSPASDLEARLKTGLTSLLGKLDLVTREEFEVQSEVLLRARTQLSALEARLNALESASRTIHNQD
jgi:BMFP domain-containing protein YqiC